MTINDGVRNTTGYTVSGLANGTRYYFRVFAHNAVGNSAPSTVVSAIPRTVVTVPGVISYFEVYADYWGFYLYWGDPVSTGGSPITNFVIQAVELRLRVLVHSRRLGRPLVELAYIYDAWLRLRDLSDRGEERCRRRSLQRLGRGLLLG